MRSSMLAALATLLALALAASADDGLHSIVSPCASGPCTLPGPVAIGSGLSVSGASVPPILAATSAPLGGTSLIAGQCTQTIVAVPGAKIGMATKATPSVYPGDGAVWNSYVSSAGNVLIKLCGIIAVTPTASIYNIRVFQ